MRNKKVAKLGYIGKKQRQFLIAAMLIPVILLLVFIVYPALNLIRLSFFNWNGTSAIQTFIGIENYIKMFTSQPNLWLALKNNCIYLLVHMIELPLSMALAVMLNTKFKGALLFKSIWFMPFIINGVGISYAFSYFFSSVNGGFNTILKLLGLEGWIQNWLSAPQIVNFTLAAVSVWRYAGYHTVMLLSALQSISDEMMEAAEIDGANAWQKFRYIQMPSIRLMRDFVIFDSVRGTLQMFDIPFVITSGGPGYASSTYTLYTIETAFSFNNFGMAAAMSVLIMAAVAGIFYLQNFLQRKLGRGEV